MSNPTGPMIAPNRVTPPQAAVVTPKAVEIPPVAAAKPPTRRVAFDGFTKKLEVFFPEGSTLQEEFYLHWFNDADSRIQRALSAGYEFVTRKEVAMNETVLPLNEDLGDRVSRVVGTKADGKPMLCFLMKLPLELRAQDEAARHAEQEAIDDVIRRGLVGAEGESAKDSANRYSPKWAGIKYDPQHPEITKRR